MKDHTSVIESFLFPELPYRSVKKNTNNIFRNVNSKICAECGGECCKICGCHFSPEDFKDLSFERLKKEMEKGYISIDYVEGEMISSILGVYILRIRNQDAPIVNMGFGKRGPCILLTEKGCKLKYKNRPAGGKLLIPSDKFDNTFYRRRQCKQRYSIYDCCYEWKPHQRLLYDLAEYFKDKDYPCSL